MELGAETVLVSGPVSLPIPPGVQMMPVETAQEMLDACEGELPADIAIFTAAVADWRVASEAPEKLKKRAGGPPVLTLAENPDILATISRAQAAAADRGRLCSRNRERDGTCRCRSWRRRAAI